MTLTPQLIQSLKQLTELQPQWAKLRRKISVYNKEVTIDQLINLIKDE